MSGDGGDTCFRFWSVSVFVSVSRFTSLSFTGVGGRSSTLLSWECFILLFVSLETLLRLSLDSSLQFCLSVDSSFCDVSLSRFITFLFLSDCSLLSLERLRLTEEVVVTFLSVLLDLSTSASDRCKLWESHDDDLEEEEDAEDEDDGDLLRFILFAFLPFPLFLFIFSAASSMSGFRLSQVKAVGVEDGMFVVIWSPA